MKKILILSLGLFMTSCIMDEEKTHTEDEVIGAITVFYPDTIITTDISDVQYFSGTVTKWYSMDGVTHITTLSTEVIYK